MANSVSNKINKLLDFSSSDTPHDDETSALKQRIEVLEQHSLDLQSREISLQNELARKNISLAEAQGRSQTFETMLNELKQTGTRFRELFSLAPIAYAAINKNGVIENINLSGTSILRYPSSKLLNTPLTDYLETDDASLFKDYLKRVSSSSLSLKCNVTLRCSDGSLKPVMLSTTAMRARQKSGLSYQVMMIDITHQLDTEKRLHNAKDYLEKLAHHDPLTGLPNRIKFSDELHSAINECHSLNRNLALLYFDLDGFKPVNDTLGHQVGDKVLCEVADRLRRCINENSIAARLGGDEFTLILRNPEDAAEALLHAEKVAQLIKQPMMIDDHEIHVSTSIGVSLFPEHALTASDLIKGADAAMYRAKKTGRGCVNLCSKESTVLASRLSTIESTLPNGIQQEQFELFYQPIYHSSDLSIKAVEALLRWNHPELGLLFPNEFIALANKSENILELGNWVLDTACKQARRWRNEGLEIPVSINLSPRQLLLSDYATAVKDTLKRYQLPSESLGFEITETASIYDHECCTQTLTELRDQNHCISLDNFGSSHSALAGLASLPVSQLKIDKVFMEELEINNQTRALVKSIINMAHEMDLEVVCEGVERSTQLEFLNANNCDAIQGFMMSRAKRVDAITKVMKLENLSIRKQYPDHDRHQLPLEKVSS